MVSTLLSALVKATAVTAGLFIGVTSLMRRLCNLRCIDSNVNILPQLDKMLQGRQLGMGCPTVGRPVRGCVWRVSYDKNGHDNDAVF